MDFSTTSTAVGIINKTGDIYEKKGFESASGYLVLVFAVLCVAMVFYYMKKQIAISEKDREQKSEMLKEERANAYKAQQEERAQNKELMEQMLQLHRETSQAQIESINKLAESLTEKMSNLSCRQEKLVEAMNNNIESVSAAISLYNDKVLENLDSEKTLSLREMDKQCKIIIENGMLHCIDYVLEKISLNSLVTNKRIIADEIIGFFRTQLKHNADRIDMLPYNDNEVKQKLYFLVEDKMMETYSNICKILDVNEGYNKDDLERLVRAERKNFAIYVNSLRFTDL